MVVKYSLTYKGIATVPLGLSIEKVSRGNGPEIGLDKQAMVIAVTWIKKKSKFRSERTLKMCLD